MTTNPPLIRDHTTGVLAALELALPGVVGDGEQAAGVGWVGAPGAGDYIGHVVCYYVFGSYDGPVADPEADGELTYQVSVFGSNRQTAERLMDLATLALVLPGKVTVAGRYVSRVRLSDDAGGARIDDPNASARLWTATPRYTVYSSPAL